MAASPSFTSDPDIFASSPAYHEKSIRDDDSRMTNPTPEPAEKPGRARKRAGVAGGQRDDIVAHANNGNVLGKIRHLKKEDGEPLWRKDIQYDFLKAIFENDQKVFTNSYEPDKIGKQCFADLYIDTMSRSSKTSKVLRDKLLSDRDAAKGMAMVCLLVNIGRMNTTLNFFPEMRAQLRTYHAIPSLQAHQDPHAYKQLQDAPRLKSILKGGAEDRREPTTLDDLKFAPVPRTNPVNLLFVITTSASKIAELHFPPRSEFYDLIMKTNYSSESRARAFLWIMWFYLESDFTEEGCEENPFGPGVDYGVDVANQGVPRLESLNAAEEAAENQDAQDEIEFGYAKQKMRAKIIEADQQFVADTSNKRGARARMLPAGEEPGPTTGILPRIRPAKPESDMDSVRSTPPPRCLGGRGVGLLGSTARRCAGPLKLQYQMYEGSSPAGGQILEGIVARKPRPPTAHQLAVERNRNQRINHILDRGIRRNHHKSRKARRTQGSILRALGRLSAIDNPFDDSEDEDAVMQNNNNLPKGYLFREYGIGGLCQLKQEEDDFGEEISSYGAALRRAERRLRRWNNHTGDDLGVVAPIKRIRMNGVGHDDDNDEGDVDMDASPSKELIDSAETEDEVEVDVRSSRSRQLQAPPKSTKMGNGVRHVRHKKADGDTPMDDADDLDDVDKELLGMADGDGEGEGEGEGDGDGDRDRDGDEGEEELDDVDKTLLGLDGDSDSD